MRQRGRFIVLILACLALSWYLTPRPSGAAGDNTTLTNGRLTVQAGSDGRFNIGAFPDSRGEQTPNSWDLMYRWPDTPRTSFSTFRIDGNDQVYGTDGSQIDAPHNLDASTDVSSWQMDDIQATQTLQLAPNLQTGQSDNVKITYTIRNTGSVAHTVGLRTMMDTELNYNDGAPFRIPGAGIIRTESEYDGSQVPDNFQVFYDVTDSTHVAAATLRGADATPPDRLVLARWPDIRSTLYDYTIDSSQEFTRDSAYALYWDPSSLAPGQSRTFVTYYGLSHLNVDLRPPLALGLNGPATLSIAGGQYSPNPFDVVATVLNNGDATATGVQLTLNLPAGLTLASGSATQPIGDLAAGSERQITWSVRAAPQTPATTLTYAVTAQGDNADQKTLSHDIQIPAAPQQQLPGAPMNVTAQRTADGKVKVSWQAPAGNVGAPYTGYVVSAYDETAGNSHRIMSVDHDASSLSIEFTAAPCAANVVRVQAKNHVGSGTPSSGAGIAAIDPPRSVVVLVMGLNSEMPAPQQNPYNPLTNECHLQSSGNNALHALGGYFDTTGRGSPQNGLTLAYALAGSGAVILPFSYNGAYFKSSAQPPQFIANSYAKSDANNADIDTAALWLRAEISSIHRMWSKTHIYVIGHSEGGLVAKTLWEEFPDLVKSKNVAGIYSLDGPINGANIDNLVYWLYYVEQQSPFSDHHGCVTIGAPCQRFLAYMDHLWQNKEADDQTMNDLDQPGKATAAFTPIGTEGDWAMQLATDSCDSLYTQELADFSSDWWGQQIGTNPCGENFKPYAMNRRTIQDGGGSDADVATGFPSHGVVYHDASNIVFLSKAVQR